MRGSPRISVDKLLLVGIIPAHAGLTELDHFVKERLQDHPRACGAHELPSNRWINNGGSSPRMRGSLRQKMRVNLPTGIIPAHAGLTFFLDAKPLLPWDHPRACGAHERSFTGDWDFSGSSPRMRGSPFSLTPNHSCRGIIPAHAGLTNGALRGIGISRDHPRACGAHLPFTALVTVRVGSSPRMRGSPKHLPISRPVVGIIPAHAGLT